ncbi:MAG: DNA recombination protein RmuC [Rhodospirillales bacterium]|nr:DNA recombination protein RmuC [Alphaproteobacteria bacterium]MCB9986681.1 DNA recombination protein RmuC [Rhodospirillales bacterium]USO06793.1 MAG: DNA recombination protein RmuC [Rhodospirillales bacterium]
MQPYIPYLAFAAGVLVGVLAMWMARRHAASQFRALSAEALNATADQFLKLAETRFGTLHEQSRGDMDNLVKPVGEQLRHLSDAVQQIRGVNSALAQQLGGLAKETARIAGALNNPRERGRAGEIMLERLLEHAGLIRDVNFRTQVVEGDIRPDFVVELKDQLRVVIDAKAPLIDLMADLEDPEKQKDAARRLSQQVRAHIKSLAAKDYARIAGSVDFVVLFLPGDGLYALAIDTDRELLDFAAANNVVLTSPMLMFGLLRMIHTMYRQQRLAENADEVRVLGAELHKRLTVFMEHFARIGASMQTSFKHFNAAIGSFESRVLPQARKFEDLQGIAAAQTLETPKRLEIVGDKHIDGEAA